MTGSVYALERAAVLRARWVIGAVVLALGIVGLFVGVASRESAVIGFTGYGRVLGGVVQGALLFLPLLGVFSTAQAVATARQQGVLEWYLSYPLSRDRCFSALFWPRTLAVLLPMLAAVLGLGLVAALSGQPVPMGMLGGFALLLLGQGYCFSALGMWVGASARTPEQALIRGLSLWVSAAALVDFVLIGVLLRWELPPYLVFLIASLNPMQAGRVGMLAVLDPELSVLGPVGLWAVTTLGPAWTAAWGLGWPLVLGTVALLGARRSFLRGDVL